VIDIGLRQTDVEEMRLEAEPFPCNDKDPDRTQETLRRHGATEREIAFLMEKRVELNAMPADVFIQWLERKLRQHGCEKVIPDDNAVLDRHARQIIMAQLLNQELDRVREMTEAAANAVALPKDLRARVRRLLRDQPDIPWDLAVAEIARSLVER
jgi:hypothetical protein